MRPKGDVPERPMDTNSDAPTWDLLRQIVVDASAAHTVEDQVERVVHGIRDAMRVDVCSLYLTVDSTLRLIANVGLAPGSVGTIELPLGEGLVGTIAATRVPLNLSVASAHPMYRHFPESGEEEFEAFLGVPVVNLGQTIGVLVVQNRRRRPFSSAEETLLITISAQLAASLLRWPEPAEAEPGSGRTRKLLGIKGSSGVGIGNVHLVGGALTVHLAESPATEDAQTESARLSQAVADIHRELEHARLQLQESMPDDVLALFDFYRMMLESDQLIAAAQRKIANGMSAFAAVRDTIDECAVAFEAIEDSYLRARGEDLHNIGNKLLNAILGHEAQIPEDESDVVLVGDLVSITDIAAFRRDQLSGIVCLQGSSLSHTAVLANALGVPAVMGVGPVDHIKNGELAIVDGDQGLVYLSPGRSLLHEYRQILDHERALQRDLLTHKLLPAVTPDGVRVALLANTGLLADVRPGLEYGAEGIGLYRSEIPFLAHSTFPTEEEQYEIYRDIIATYHPRPVTMRTLDIGGDKPLPYLTMEEDNPSLGWRGVRFALDNRPVFLTQLRAMLRADAGYETMRLLLPMVSSVDDVVQVLALLDMVSEQLGREGLAVRRPPLGIMVEVPAVIALLSSLARHIQFISIGTNDLTQYLLAVDRNNPRVSKRYDALHPAVLRSSRDLVKRAVELKLGVSLCGELAADPVAAPLLLGMRIEALSMSAFHIPRIKELIRGYPFADARRLLNRALRIDNQDDIRSLAAESLRAHGLDHLLMRGSGT